MKILTIFLISFFGVFLFSCSSKTKNNNNQLNMDKNVLDSELNVVIEQNNEVMKVEDVKFPIFIDYNKPTVDYIVSKEIRSKLKSNIDIIYKPESDVILNLDEIENISIYEIFDRIVLNGNFCISSTYSDNHYFKNISDLLYLFNVKLNPNDIENINSIQDYYATIKVSTEYMNLYITKDTYSYRLFMVEYDKNSSIYNFNLKMESEKDELLKMFGIPAYNSEDENIYVYIVL